MSDQNEQERYRYLQLKMRINKPQQTQPLSMGQKIWGGLEKPEQISRRGLNGIAEMLPNSVTGNLPRDLAVNAPRIGAESMAKVAPEFISRESILTAGASPLIGRALKSAAPIGKLIGAGLEDWTGIKPAGTLEEAFKGNVSAFSKSTKAAKAGYQEAMKELPYEQTIFKGIGKNKDIAEKAIQIIDSKGKLEPQEGLIARKALDRSKKLYSDDAFNYYRTAFDKIAKSNSDIAASDPLHRRGMMAEALRSIGPKNVGGRISPFKIGEAMALSHLGPFGKLASLAFSPAAIGAVSSGLGTASRIASDPMQAVAALQLLRKKNEDSNP